MTTIIGYEHEQGCVIASDTQTTAGDGYPFTHPDLVKILSRGGYLIAVSGENQSCDIAAHLWDIPERDDSPWYQFGIRVLSPSLRAAHEVNGFAPDKQNDWAVMIASRGELLTIESDYSILRAADGLYGMGSGSAYALGALTILLGVTSVTCAMERAVLVASRFDVFTSNETNVVTQRKEVAY